MRQRWKKGLLLITACLMMSVVGCGKQESDTSQTTETTVNSTDTTQNSTQELTQDTIQDTTTKTEDTETTEAQSIINLWYTDDTMTPYLQDVSDTFETEHNILINLVLTSSVEYLENINQKNIEETDKADLFILNSTSLEKAYLAGLALELTDGAYDKTVYPEVANIATMYQGKNIAYPFYYETEFFLYNKNFAEVAPNSFQEIIDFSETYEGNYDGMESILKWDVRNLFYSYGFLGAYANLGGVYGDDRSVVDLNNEKVINALTFFKQLNQSLYFDALEVNNATALSDFLEGKILYTITGTQNLSTLLASNMSYGIAPLPRLNDELESKGLSTNYVVAVNPYGDFIDMSKELAVAITDKNTNTFYEMTGKLPCKTQDSSIYPNEEISHIVEAYEKSAQIPKLMDVTNFWVELEVTLNNIWKAEMREEEAQEDLSDGSQAEDDGTDEIKKQKVIEQIRELVTEEINALQEKMELQLSVE